MTAASLRFDRFELQPLERRLFVDGRAAPLGARAFDVLLALVARPGQLHTKQALLDAVWPDVVVEENNLQAQISALRKVLGGDVIATIPGRGYRFVAQLLGTAADAGAAPPAAAPSSGGRAGPKTNLPETAEALFGREDDLALLATLVADHRLVTLTGAGGIGKSRLAQALLQQRRSAYPHGVCWVELAAVTDAAALPGAVASALGVQVGGGEPLAALLAAVAPLCLLLALDNAEHLLGDVARLALALHDAAPGLHCLVTSQAPLRLAPERVHGLGALAVPAGPLPANEARRYGAVALFVERAAALDARYVLTDAQAPAVIDLCRALDGVALAIELAAARVPLLGVQRLAGALHERLALLTHSADRTAPPRQRTLRAALEWSHALLDGAEQAVFRRLAVVAGSATLELVQAIVVEAADPAAHDAWRGLDALDALVDRSLVAVSQSGATGTPRYRLLDTPRGYALECLAQAGETALLRRRHAAAMAEALDRAWSTRHDGSTAVAEWLSALEADLDNARVAFAWARAQGDADRAVRIGATLLRALPPSLHAEGTVLAERVEALLANDLSPATRLRGWLAVGIWWDRLPTHHGVDAAPRAVALARDLADAPDGRFALYQTLCRQAMVAWRSGDPSTAEAALTEVRLLEDRSWPPHQLLVGAETQAFCAHLAGDPQACRLHMRRRLVLQAAAGASSNLALASLVDTELSAGDAAAAIASGRQLIAQLRDTRDEFSLALARLNLAAAWLASDRPAEARALAGLAWPQVPAFDLQRDWADYLALLAAIEGRPRCAAQLAGWSEARYAADGQTRQPNERRAHTRACSIARSALGAPIFDALLAAGGERPDTAVERLAFQATDDD